MQEDTFPRIAQLVRVGAGSQAQSNLRAQIVKKSADETLAKDSTLRPGTFHPHGGTRSQEGAVGGAGGGRQCL